MNRSTLLFLMLLTLLCAQRSSYALMDGPIRQVQWQKSTPAALSWAKNEHCPIMVVISRKGNALDTKWVEKMQWWPQIVELSVSGRMAAVMEVAETPNATELLARVNLRAAPAVVFLDQNGNALTGFPFSETVQPIADTVSNWKALSGNIDAFFTDHLVRAEKLLAKGKLKDAYFEYSYVAPFKGPEADKGRAGQMKIQGHWMSLLEVAIKQPPTSIARSAIYKGLRKDASGTTFSDGMEEAIYKAENGGALPSTTGPSVASAKISAKPTAPVKTLAEMARAPSSSSMGPSSNAENDDAPSDSSLLLRSTDPRLQQAEKLLQQGYADYKKAIADSSDRGPARNQLLKSAHTNFEQALTMMEQAKGAKADTALDKVMERASMLMYGSLKYQSL